MHSPHLCSHLGGLDPILLKASSFCVVSKLVVGTSCILVVGTTLKESAVYGNKKTMLFIIGWNLKTNTNTFVQLLKWGERVCKYN